MDSFKRGCEQPVISACDSDSRDDNNGMYY